MIQRNVLDEQYELLIQKAKALVMQCDSEVRARNAGIDPEYDDQPLHDLSNLLVSLGELPWKR